MNNSIIVRSIRPPVSKPPPLLLFFPRHAAPSRQKHACIITHLRRSSSITTPRTRPRPRRRVILPIIISTATATLSLLIGYQIGSVHLAAEAAGVSPWVAGGKTNTSPPAMGDSDDDDDHGDVAAVALQRKLNDALQLVPDLRVPRSDDDDDDNDNTPWRELEARSGSNFNNARRWWHSTSTTTVFYNPPERVSIQVLHLHRGLAGWPRVTHGGALATAMFDALARTARAAEADQNQDDDDDDGAVVVVRSLSLRYCKPTPTEGVYVLRVQVVDHAGHDEDDDEDEKRGLRTSVRRRLTARLESLDGKIVFVEACGTTER